MLTDSSIEQETVQRSGGATRCAQQRRVIIPS
jgi:hypothetical protein